MIKPTLCIYHAPCADGFSAAWAVWKRFGNSVRYHAGVHGEAPPDVSNEHVVMVDFSYKSPIVRALAAQAASMTILDHHRSAVLDLTPLMDDGTLTGVFDMERSGAVITWEYFHDEPVPELLLHIQDQDLWQFKLDGTREISATVFSFPYDFEMWSWLAEQCETDVGKQALLDEGRAIERKHRKDVFELLESNTRRMVIGGVNVPVANLPYTMASDGAGDLAYEESFAACYFDRADARVFSLRSRGETGVDVSVIASSYGGGGHIHSAGFTVPLSKLMELGLL